MGRTIGWRVVGQHLLLGVACLAAAWVGLHWSDRTTATLAFWPAAGIALHGVRRLGPPSGWAVAAGLLPAFIGWGVSPLPSLVIVLGNAIAAIAAGAWIQRHVPTPGAGNVRLLGRVLLVVGGASVIAAIAGMAAAWGWREGATPAAIWRIGLGGFLGHFAGVVVFAPLLNAWWRKPRLGGQPMPGFAQLHLFIVLALIALVCWPLFLTDDGAPVLRIWHLYPLLIWAALAFRLRGASAAMLVVSIAAIVGVINGLGPFGTPGEPIWAAVLTAQQFVILTSLVILLLAEVADERRLLGPLRAARLRFDFALDAAGMVGWEYNSDGSRIRSFGDVERFYGRPVTTGAELAAAIHPEDREATLKAASQALRVGERDYELEYRILLPDGNVRHVLARGRAVGLEGAPPSLSGIAIDITDRRRDEERQALLMAELDHRVKNILATIQALISRTATDKISVAELVATLKGRVQAMARAHSMLARNRWEGASLKGLLEDELSPYGGTRVALLGPDVQLLPRAALSLSLVFHELATNAAKYGALSGSEGRLAVGWAIEATGGAGGPILSIEWHERGGPKVEGRPARRGFGSVMTGRVVQNEFGGSLDIDYAAAGLSVSIRLPFGRVGRGGLASATPPPPTPPPPVSPSVLAGRRVLFVEDSPVIADATAAQLRAAGLEVDGPHGSVASALAALDQSSPDAALLDVNLGEELVFPLAERLEALGVPFLFVTGYGNDAMIPERFRDRRRLLKPIDEPVLIATIGALLAI